jgi:hypothetical protein
MSYVSGTLGAGSMVHAYTLGQVTKPTAGTQLTTVSALLNGSSGKALAFQGSTLVAAPLIIRPSMTFGPALATTPAFPSLVQDFVDGSIEIPPGVAYAFQGVATAGTAPLVMIGVGYAEIPIVNP